MKTGMTSNRKRPTEMVMNEWLRRRAHALIGTTAHTRTAEFIVCQRKIFLLLFFIGICPYYIWEKISAFCDISEELRNFGWMKWSSVYKCHKKTLSILIKKEEDENDTNSNNGKWTKFSCKRFSQSAVNVDISLHFQIPISRSLSPSLSFGAWGVSIP